MTVVIKWTAIGAVLIIDIIWAYALGIALSWSVAPVLAFTSTIALLYSTLRPNELIATLFQSATEIMLSFCVVGALTYLCYASNLAAVDEYLSAADRMLFFDWLAWKRVFDEHRLVNAVFSFCYWSLAPQIMIAAIFLSATNRTGRLKEFTFVFVITLVSCGIIAVTFPSDSACALYGVDVEACRLDTIRELRAGHLSEIAFGQTKGIITFPSFHAASALIFIWVSRGIPLVFLSSLAINTLMFFATPIIGGHYLVDVIAGSLIMLGVSSAYSWLLSSEAKRENARRPTAAI
jgi:hypothetical protein